MNKVKTFGFLIFLGLLSACSSQNSTSSKEGEKASLGLYDVKSGGKNAVVESGGEKSVPTAPFSIERTDTRKQKRRQSSAKLSAMLICS